MKKWNKLIWLGTALLGLIVIFIIILVVGLNGGGSEPLTPPVDTTVTTEVSESLPNYLSITGSVATAVIIIFFLIYLFTKGRLKKIFWIVGGILLVLCIIWFITSVMGINTFDGFIGLGFAILVPLILIKVFREKGAKLGTKVQGSASWLILLVFILSILLIAYREGKKLDNTISNGIAKAGAIQQKPNMTEEQIKEFNDRPLDSAGSSSGAIKSPSKRITLPAGEVSHEWTVPAGETWTFRDLNSWYFITCDGVTTQMDLLKGGELVVGAGKKVSIKRKPGEDGKTNTANAIGFTIFVTKL